MERLRALCGHIAVGRPTTGPAPASSVGPSYPDPRLPAEGLQVVAEPEIVQQCGEQITFRVSYPSRGGANVSYTLTADGHGPALHEGTLQLDVQGHGQCSGSLAVPGFLTCSVACDGDTALAGAGVDPYSIAPSLPPPADFDAFWAQQKALQAATPPNTRLEPLAAALQQPGVEAFDVQADSAVGAGLSGYMARPAGAAPRSLPAVLIVHGAGVYSSNLESAQDWARGGGPGIDIGNQCGRHIGEGPHGMAAFSQSALALDLNAHGIPNGREESYYAELGAEGGALHNYNQRGRMDRESCYFRGMLLRLIRAIDVLTAQPEWDQRTVVLFGVSQGGFQAIAAAGLDPRVTFFAAGVPAGCDHTGHLAPSGPRISGWPKLAVTGLGVSSSEEEQACINEASQYYDCVSFAQRAHAPAQFSVGFIDTACPPTSVFAAFNNLPALSGTASLSGHAIHYDAWAGHEHTPAADVAMRGAVLAHFDAMGHH